jgi:hypothetical protein
MDGEERVLHYGSPVVRRQVCKSTRQELHNGPLKSRNEKFDRLLSFLIGSEKSDSHLEIQFFVIGICHPHDSHSITSVVSLQ